MLFPQQPLTDLVLRLITPCGLRVDTTKWANGMMKRGWPTIVARLRLSVVRFLYPLLLSGNFSNYSWAFRLGHWPSL